MTEFLAVCEKVNSGGMGAEQPARLLGFAQKT
jgi:hypothetical protein